GAAWREPPHRRERGRDVLLAGVVVSKLATGDRDRHQASVPERAFGAAPGSRGAGAAPVSGDYYESVARGAVPRAAHGAAARAGITARDLGGHLGDQEHGGVEHAAAASGMERDPLRGRVPAAGG